MGFMSVCLVCRANGFSTGVRPASRRVRTGVLPKRDLEAFGYGALHLVSHAPRSICNVSTERNTFFRQAMAAGTAGPTTTRPLRAKALTPPVLIQCRGGDGYLDYGFLGMFRHAGRKDKLAAPEVLQILFSAQSI